MNTFRFTLHCEYFLIVSAGNIQVSYKTAQVVQKMAPPQVMRDYSQVMCEADPIVHGPGLVSFAVLFCVRRPWLSSRGLAPWNNMMSLMLQLSMDVQCTYLFVNMEMGMATEQFTSDPRETELAAWHVICP